MNEDEKKEEKNTLSHMIRTDITRAADLQSFSQILFKLSHMNCPLVKLPISPPFSAYLSQAFTEAVLISAQNLFLLCPSANNIWHTAELLFEKYRY